MQIKRNYVERKSLAVFAREHGLVMTISERTDRSLPRFWASFANVEVKAGGMLIGAYGDGDNEEEAIRSYADKLSGKLIVISADKPDERKEVFTPFFTYYTVAQ